MLWWVFCKFGGPLEAPPPGRLPLGKELCAFTRQDAAHGPGPALADPVHLFDREGQLRKSRLFRVVDGRAAVDGVEFAPVDRRSTHRARLGGRVHLASRKIDGRERAGGVLNAHDLRMSGRVGAFPDLVVPARHQLAGANDDSTERRLA